jgi:hypothetical protein
MKGGSYQRAYDLSAPGKRRGRSWAEAVPQGCRSPTSTAPGGVVGLRSCRLAEAIGRSPTSHDVPPLLPAQRPGQANLRDRATREALRCIAGAAWAELVAASLGDHISARTHICECRRPPGAGE